MNELLKIAVPAGIVLLSATIIVDSFFWRRPLWPEGEVLWYNTILNKSSNWGVSPFLWYFYSAIPRAMGTSVLFIPFGLYLEPRSRSLGIAATTFIFLYSFLPHKELRFIIYVFPLLNIAVACACHRIWINRTKSLWKACLAFVAGAHLIINAFFTIFLLIVSSTNYPGGIALSRLHRLAANETNVSVHICNLAAQSGVSRFMQVRPDWKYSKKENLSYGHEELNQFTHLLVEAKNKLNTDWPLLTENFVGVEFIDCFSNIGIQYNSIIPIKVKTKPCIGIMKRRPHVKAKQMVENVTVDDVLNVEYEQNTDSISPLDVKSIEEEKNFKQDNLHSSETQNEKQEEEEEEEDEYLEEEETYTNLYNEEAHEEFPSEEKEESSERFSESAHVLPDVKVSPKQILDEEGNELRPQSDENIYKSTEKVTSFKIREKMPKSDDMFVKFESQEDAGRSTEKQPYFTSKIKLSREHITIPEEISTKTQPEDYGEKIDDQLSYSSLKSEQFHEHLLEYPSKENKEKLTEKPAYSIPKIKLFRERVMLSKEKPIEYEGKSIERPLHPLPSTKQSPDELQLQDDNEKLTEKLSHPKHKSSVERMNTMAMEDNEITISVENSNELYDDQYLNQLKSREVNFQELRNLALGTLSKSTKEKLRHVIEQHYKSKGSIVESEAETKRKHSKISDLDSNKPSTKTSIKNIIKQEKIKDVIEKVSQMDLIKMCNLDKMTTKECLKQAIDNIDENSNA